PRWVAPAELLREERVFRAEPQRFFAGRAALARDRVDRRRGHADRSARGERGGRRGLARAARDRERQERQARATALSAPQRTAPDRWLPRARARRSPSRTGPRAPPAPRAPTSRTRGSRSKRRRAPPISRYHPAPCSLSRTSDARQATPKQRLGQPAEF